MPTLPRLPLHPSPSSTPLCHKIFYWKKKSPSSREVGRTSSDIGTGHQLICRVFPEPTLQDRAVEACTRRLGPQGAEAGVYLPVSGPEGRLEAGEKCGQGAGHECAWSAGHRGTPRKTRSFGRSRHDSPRLGAGDRSSLRPGSGFQVSVPSCLAPNCPHSK